MKSFREVLRRVSGLYGTSFRRKALSVAIPGLILASVVYTYDAVRTENAIMRSEIRKKAEVLAHLASRIGELPIISGNPELLKNAVSFLKTVPEVTFVAFYDTRMNLLMSDGKVAGPAMQPSEKSPLFIQEENDFFDLCAPVFIVKAKEDIDIFQGTDEAATVKENAGWVRVGFSKASMIKEQRAIIWRGLLFALIFTVVTGSLVYSLFSVATRPLSMLAKALNGVRKGEYPEIQITSADEVGILASEYTRMVSAIRDRETLLMESERRIRELFNRVEHAIFRLDNEGRIVDTNRKFNELCPGTREFCGLFADGEAAGRLEEAMMGAINNVEEKVRGGDGRELTVVMSIYPEFDSGGIIVGYDGYFVDVTEKKRLEETLIQTQKLESLGLLAGGIAHDFNNILTGILGYSSLSKSLVDSGGKLHKYLDTIEKSAARASSLAGQLLGFARKGKYKMEKLNVNNVVKELGGFLQEAIDRNITIVMELGQDLPPVEGDNNQIYQALMNLCINARDAMPEGGRMYIKTEFYVLQPGESAEPFQFPSGEYVKISVTDTGVGMAPEVKKRIFEPFYTTKSVGKGTGLGMAMVYGIVKNHSGYINVYSEPNLGTTVRIYLPKTEGMVEERRRCGNMDERSLRGTILIIDDEEVVRELGKDILESYNYEVMLAMHGNDGVKVFSENRDKIDLVILDMVMPEKSGRLTFKEIKAIRPDSKVLLCSGYGQEQYFHELFEAGAAGFLQKPFLHGELLNKVEAAIGK